MKIGLTLSGGGARGISHLGVMKALDELGITYNYISGTSAGAVIGALYSYGYTPDEILQLILSTKFFKSLRIAWTLKGLLNLSPLGEVLLKLMPENNFEKLKIPVTIAATNIRRGRVEYFAKGELIQPLLCSCCVPAVFNPISFNGDVYVDGGILDNLPVKAIHDKCDFMIGSHSNFITSEFDIKNIRSVIERSLLMAISGNTTISKTLCNVLIEPPGVGKFSGFDLGKAKEIFDIGYRYTKENYTIDHFKP
jgi:NTE family protein